ncbi:hypothetical protein GCM10011499_18140 [Pelagibacterium lentulum]|uniref:Uncharacterized protein n=1 Tax=Pelagibacterium lentulum TaxID=2029865 RepID=A0A916RE41_9HYPH|nr:hypothetical protein GCM10011499_18140 [Pelagibacterium lentulum]
MAKLAECKGDEASRVKVRCREMDSHTNRYSNFCAFGAPLPRLKELGAGFRANEPIALESLRFTSLFP